MKKIAILLIVFALVSNLSAQKAQMVNPFVGTDSHGHTYPGVVAPFGMVQLSPDTRLSGWDGCSGYHYSDNKIYGFSHTHLSGTGVEDLCDFLFVPTVHSQNYEDLRLSFSHSDEEAIAGYYKVKGFNKQSITVELAADERHGYHLYTYPKNDTMAVVIDLKHRDLEEGEIKDGLTVVWQDINEIIRSNTQEYYKSLVNSQGQPYIIKRELEFFKTILKENMI